MQFKTEEGDVRQWLTVVSVSFTRHMECATYFFVAEAFSERVELATERLLEQDPSLQTLPWLEPLEHQGL